VGCWYVAVAHCFFNIASQKKCKRVFEFVKVIIQNIAHFFHPRYSKNGIFDGVVVMSTLHSDE